MALFSLVGFVGVPVLLRYVITGPVAAALDRPVRLGDISFNPYLLKANLDQLHIGERGTAQPFVDVSHVRLRLSWASLWRLALVVKELHVEQPVMRLVRTPDQRLNISDLLARPATADESRHHFPMLVSYLQLTNGTAHIADAGGTTSEALTLEGLHAELHDLRTTDPTPASFVMGASLSAGGVLALKGRLDLAQAQVSSDVSLDQINLPAVQGLVPAALPAQFASGSLSAKAQVQASFAAGQFHVHAEPARVALDQVEWSVPDHQERPLIWSHLEASITSADWPGRQVMVQEIRVDGIKVLVQRERNGEILLAALIPAPTSAQAPQSRAAAAWHYRIDSLVLHNAEARLNDAAVQPGVELVVGPMHLQLKDLSNDWSQPVALDFDGEFNRQGRLTIAGTAVPSPLQADLRVATEQLDLAALGPYLSDRLRMTMRSASVTMDGIMALAMGANEPHVSYRGDATLGNVELLDQGSSEALLRWNSCRLSAIEAEMGEGPPQVRIAGVALSDFDARLLLDSNGRLNIWDMLEDSQTAPASQTHSQRSPDGQRAGESPATGPHAATAINADIALGGIALQGGHVTFTDNFIQPHYTADLTEVTGTVGGFGSRAATPADVSLQGQVNDSAPIAITGAINPLTPLAFVDLKAKAQGIELTGLTPYSAKYTGYPIIKGTLTVDVHYLLNQGQLTADNHLFIDQFTFGDRVESRDATTLPVRLAVALLKNARGEIDVDVPVSGSLSDPQFSVSGVILDAFANFIAKVVTSPFRLIANAFGTREDLDFIEFAPGLATLTSDSQHKLADLARALQDRPALQLEISGRVDPQIDGEGLRQARLESLIRSQKSQETGGPAEPDRVQLTPEEYETYLTRVYKAATFPKPHDFLGLDKSLPPDEMKKLLLSHMQISEQDLRRLADGRAQAVRQELRGTVEARRLSVVAPRLKADGDSERDRSTGVKLSLK